MPRTSCACDFVLGDSVSKRQILCLCALQIPERPHCSHFMYLLMKNKTFIHLFINLILADINNIYFLFQMPSHRYCKKLEFDLHDVRVVLDAFFAPERNRLLTYTPSAARQLLAYQRAALEYDGHLDYQVLRRLNMDYRPRLIF